MRGGVAALVPVALLALVLALVAAPLTGCLDLDGAVGSQRRPAPTPTVHLTGTPAEVAAVLARRARAVVAHDGGGFEATVAPGAGAAYQRFWYAQAVRVGLRSLSYDLSTPDLAASHGDTYVTMVDEKLEIGPVDPGTVTVEHRLVLHRSAGTWRVTRDTWDHSQVIAAPWELPGTRITTRPGLVLVTGGFSRQVAEALADDAAGAVRAVTSDLPGRLHGAVVLALHHDTTPFRAESIDRRELSLLGGITVPMDFASTNHDSARVVLPAATVPAARPWRRQLLRHEITHVALAADTVAPIWAREGTAEYYAHRREWDPKIHVVTIDAARRGIQAMPADAEFYAGGLDTWSRHYDLSWWAMEWVAGQKGPGEPARLLDAFQKGDVRYDADVDALLRKRYGVDRAGLARKAAALILEYYG